MSCVHPGRARANLYARCPQVVSGLRFTGACEAALLGHWDRVILDVAYGLGRVLLPDTVWRIARGLLDCAHGWCTVPKWSLYAFECCA